MKTTPNNFSLLVKMTVPVVCLVAIATYAIRETSKILSGESEEISNQLQDIIVYGGCLVVLVTILALPTTRLRIIAISGFMALIAVLIYLKSLLPF